MKVLVVEDDALSQNFMTYALERHGEVVIAENGEEGVALFRDAVESGDLFDLLCLDIMMPVMDGHEALAEIRKIEGQAGIAPDDGIKVIMTTAVDNARSVVDAYYKGNATAYLVKPIRVDKLLGVLRKFKLIDVECR